MKKLRLLVPVLALGALVAVPLSSASSPTNVRVTNDNTTNTAYLSADQLGGTGSYSDGVLRRCGTDRREQNEPTLAIDPRNPNVWAAGANDYCTVPTTNDGWPGYYLSTDAGARWTDTLVPGYPGDTSPQAQSSPLARLAANGALAAGDPVAAWDGAGRLFFMGNNFDRGIQNGNSFTTRRNNGSIWITTYEPSNPARQATDGRKFVRTVLLATNTFGQGNLSDKTAMTVDQQNGNVYAAWSNYHGFGCNEILFSRSTDHGATFSKPMKISTGICINQGPSFAIGPNGEIYIAWQATLVQNGTSGAAFIVSTNGGKSFSKPRIVLQYTPFVSEAFSGNGARECGDAPSACPSGYTFPRFDLASPFLAADNSHDTLVMAFQEAQADGQGQIAYSVSRNGGATWTAPALLSPSSNGHQFYPYLAASSGVVSAIWYDSYNSAGDSNYSPDRPPCNTAGGAGYPCLNVRYASSTDGGNTWTTSTDPVTSEPTNPNYEQFGGRTVPFIGDYITVAAAGNTIGAVWTDQRDTAAGTGSSDGNDVAGDPETSGPTCGSITAKCWDRLGGLDQNIYAAKLSP